MKLETTQDLLERVRARFEGCSYYRLSKHLGISEPTIANWKHGRSGIGREHVTRVAEALEGKLDPIARPWRGWVLRGEHLVSPEGWQFTFGEIRAIPFMHAQIRTYQRLQRCVQQADWIEQRYVAPAEASVTGGG